MLSFSSNKVPKNRLPALSMLRAGFFIEKIEELNFLFGIINEVLNLYARLTECLFVVVFIQEFFRPPKGECQCSKVR